MVFSLWHILPSALSAILIILLVYSGKRGEKRHLHRRLSFSMALLAALGMAGYLNQGNIRFYPFDQHVLHSYLGLIAFILSFLLFVDAKIAPDRQEKHTAR